MPETAIHSWQLLREIFQQSDCQLVLLYHFKDGTFFLDKCVEGHCKFCSEPITSNTSALSTVIGEVSGADHAAVKSVRYQFDPENPQTKELLERLSVDAASNQKSESSNDKCVELDLRFVVSRFFAGGSFVGFLLALIGRDELVSLAQTQSAIDSIASINHFFAKSPEHEPDAQSPEPSADDEDPPATRSEPAFLPNESHGPRDTVKQLPDWIQVAGSRSRATNQPTAEQPSETANWLARQTVDAPSRDFVEQEFAEDQDFDDDDDIEDDADIDDEERFDIEDQQLETSQQREQILAMLIGKVNYVEYGYALTNELSRYLACDRVALIDKVGEKFRVVAVSAQPTFNKRSNLIRRMTFLAKATARAGRIYWSTDSDLPPQLEAPFDDYCGESRSRSVGLYPLKYRPRQPNPTDHNRLSQIVNEGDDSSSPTLGVILVESMEEPLDQDLISQRLNPLLPSLAAATHAKKHYHDLLLMPAMIRMSWFFELFRGKTQKKAFAITGLIAGLILLALLVPADLLIRCEGEIRPARVRAIFGTNAARIVRLHVEDGQIVKQGDPLVDMEARELQIERDRAYTEYLSAAQEYEDLGLQEATPRYFRELSNSEKADLRVRRAKAKVEAEGTLQIVNELDAELQRACCITSPVDGQVFGWNIQERLMSRPISPGDRLFNIAAEGSEYVLRLEVPDQRLGYIAEAFRKARADNRPLEVQYLVASNMSQIRYGAISKVASMVDPGSQKGVVLPVEATLNDSTEALQAEGLKPGTAVIAKIKCGRRSFAYCKLYEFVDWGRRTWFRYVH